LGRSLFSEITKITLKIFFDLDGPILDVSKRYYRVFRDVCPDNVAINKKDFWKLKQNKTSWKVIFKKAKVDIKEDKFKKLWMDRIETKDYLGLDVLQPKAKRVLFNLSKKYPLFLLSLRQSKTNLYWQVDKIGISKYFKKIIYCKHKKEFPWSVKAELIRKYLSKDELALVVGDSEVDIKAAKLSKVRSIGITSGIRSPKLLAKEKPDILIPNIQLLTKLI